MLLGSITCFAQESGAGWWHDLGDSVLDSLVDVGVRNNYDVAMAARRIGIARAGVGTARAGNIRFRPIMMTALAFVFCVMPMLFATEAGAASCISLGAAVVFGMAMNAAVGTLLVPPLWKLLQPRKSKTTASESTEPSENSENSEDSTSPTSPHP